MTRLIAVLATLCLVAIPAKADVALWPSPVSGWTVIQVYGEIQPDDFATFQRYTENVDPDATLVIVTGPGGNLSAGIRMGILVHQKKLIVGAMGLCSSSCALIWIGGEPGRKFLYQDRPGVLTFVCFHEAHLPGDWRASAPGTAVIVKYLAALGYNQDMIEWAIAAVPTRQRCLNPELAKQFNIDFWYNTEDGGQNSILPGNHGMLLTPLGPPTNHLALDKLAPPFHRWGGHLIGPDDGSCHVMNGVCVTPTCHVVQGVCLPR